MQTIDAPTSCLKFSSRATDGHVRCVCMHGGCGSLYEWYTYMLREAHWDDVVTHTNGIHICWGKYIGVM